MQQLELQPKPLMNKKEMVKRLKEKEDPLHISQDKWIRLRDTKEPEKITEDDICSSTCALCTLHLDFNCRSCPINCIPIYREYLDAMVTEDYEYMKELAAEMVELIDIKIEDIGDI